MYASDLRLHLAVDLVVLTLRENRLSVLLVRRSEEPFSGWWALPGDLVGRQESLVGAARRVLRDVASVDRPDVYLEQVRTFGDPKRDPRSRVVSVSFMALGAKLPETPEGDGRGEVSWWALEDLDEIELAFDHRALLASAIDRARAKLEYTTLAVTFLPEEFTISQLRGVYESVWGAALDAGNFHRKATRTPGFIVELDRLAAPTGGRPARLYRAGDGTRLNPPLLRSSVPSTDSLEHLGIAGPEGLAESSAAEASATEASATEASAAGAGVAEAVVGKVVAGEAAVGEAAARPEGDETDPSPEGTAAGTGADGAKVG